MTIFQTQFWHLLSESS